MTQPEKSQNKKEKVSKNSPKFLKNNQKQERTKPTKKTENKPERKRNRKSFLKFLEELPTIFQIILLVILIFLAGIIRSSNPIDWYDSYKIKTAKTAKERDQLKKAQEKSLAEQNAINRQMYTLNKLKNNQGYLTYQQVDKYGNANHLYIVTDNKTGVEYFYQNPNITGKSTGGNIVMKERKNSKNQPIINSAWQSEQEQKLTPEQKAKVNVTVKDKGIMGDVTVMKSGHVVYSNATANRKNSLYLINSVQKSMTATLILQAIQEGKVKLSDKLSKFYPTINGSNNITIANLLDMQSGLSCPTVENNSVNNQNVNQTIWRLTPNIQYTPAKQGKVVYDSINYVILAGILTKVEHQSYEKIFTNKIIKKLKLDETTFDYKDKNVITGHIFNKATNTSSRAKFNKVQVKNLTGAGDVFISNKDLLTIINAELNGKLLNSKMQAEFNQIANAQYHDGFWIKNGIRQSNGNGRGYNSALRISSNGKTIVLIQSNYNNNFANVKQGADSILDITTKKNIAKKD